MSRSTIWKILAAFYLIFRFAFTRELDSLGAYASYLLEISMVTVGVLLYGARFREFLRAGRAALVGAFAGLLTGFAVFRLAIFQGVVIPFDLSGFETVLFLVIVAPLLEELIFRFFLWEPLSVRPVVAWVLTSVIFSYSHFHVLWFMPAEIHPFIVYQTLYTLLLGLACGYFVFKQRSLVGAIATHFTFNLGFYLASFV